MAVEEPGQDPTSPQDARLASLDERLKRAERVESKRRPAPDSKAIIRSTGMRLAQSLVGMPIGGAIIGWLLDRWLETAPWIMLGLMFTGFVGAVIDVMKVSKGTRDSGK